MQFNKEEAEKRRREAKKRLEEKKAAAAASRDDTRYKPGMVTLLIYSGVSIMWIEEKMKLGEKRCVIFTGKNVIEDFPVSSCIPASEFWSFFG